MFNGLLRKFMTYASSCEDDLGLHVCDPCNGNREFARVRSVAIIPKEALAALMVDPTSPTKWAAAIAAGAIIIPNTSGSFDPGDPKVLKGYGDTLQSNGPRTQKLTFFDPNFRANYAFYNAISNITSKVVAFRTSTLIHIADVTAAIVAKDVVADDLEAELVWEVTATFISINMPNIHDASALTNIFKCS